MFADYFKSYDIAFYDTSNIIDALKLETSNYQKSVFFLNQNIFIHNQKIEFEKKINFLLFQVLSSSFVFVSFLNGWT